MAKLRMFTFHHLKFRAFGTLHIPKNYINLAISVQKKGI